jgi:hypothetical protein
MSWLYSQVLVAEYSEANSSDGAQSAPLSGNPTPQAYCASDRMKAFSRLSRFGMMFAPLTDDHGEAVLTWFLAGFLAKTSAQPEREQALTELEADCGKKWRGLLVKWDQDMFSSKTVLCSEQEDSTLFSKTLPKWGMMLDGECWEQLTPVRLTKETECGLEPNGETFFHTPNTGGLDGGSNSRRALKKRMESLWPTPCVQMSQRKTTNGENRSIKTGQKFGLSLAQEAKMWPTPTKSDHKGSGPTMMRSDGKMRGDRLDYATERNLDGTPTGGQLNPTWVEWLMGWPLGWTDLKPLEMDKSQRWPHSHGIS